RTHHLIFFSRALAHRHLPSFPTRRSSDLTPPLDARSCRGPATYVYWQGGRKACRPSAGHSPLESRAALQPSAPRALHPGATPDRSEEHTSELQSRGHLVCRLLLEKKKKQI